jgi:hypothetical protein
VRFTSHRSTDPVERKRLRLARTISRVILEAERPSHTVFSAAVPVEREGILRCEHELLGLADTLRATAQPVSREGVAKVERLLRDGASPVYTPMGDGALEDAVREARAALVPRA